MSTVADPVVGVGVVTAVTHSRLYNTQRRKVDGGGCGGTGRGTRRGVRTLRATVGAPEPRGARRLPKTPPSHRVDDLPESIPFAQGLCTGRLRSAWSPRSGPAEAGRGAVARRPPGALALCGGRQSGPWRRAVRPSRPFPVPGRGAAWGRGDRRVDASALPRPGGGRTFSGGLRRSGAGRAGTACPRRAPGRTVRRPRVRRPVRGAPAPLRRADGGGAGSRLIALSAVPILPALRTPGGR